MRTPVVAHIAYPTKFLRVPDKAGFLLLPLSGAISCTAFILEANLIICVAMLFGPLIIGWVTMMALAAREPNIVGLMMAQTFARKPRPQVERRRRRGTVEFHA